MVQKKLTGTGVAIITPFRNDGSVDFKSLGKLLEHIIKGGIDYVVVLGTTGESVTLSKDEKKAVVNFVIEAVSSRIPIVVGIGGNNTQEILDSLNYNDFNNIDAILSVSPYYNKPSQQGIYEHFKTIAGISPVPVILYNVPGRTGSNMTGETTVRLANDFGNIVAIKEASGNMAQIMHILKNKPADFLVISGDDLITLPMMSMGAVGAISVIANAFPAEFTQMVNFALHGNFVKAATLQFKLLDMMNAIFEEGSPSGVKATLEILKVSPNNLRLPLVPVSEVMYKKLEQLVKLV
ncbi:MAG TPA: 4-hydroxy-tetrahydrodipicolinate synthase [Bacteroidales bacterium]|nr:4-hydroxy-tetrahydrodipicolinate synthase [Bacteroidales bacterium]